MGQRSLKRPLAKGFYLFLLVALATGYMLGPARIARAATIVVNTTADEYNTNPGACSLREAVEAANTDAPFGGCPAGSGDDTITLPAGAYTLTLAGTPEDANTRGDLDLTSNLTLQGAGASTTIVDGNGSTLNDRVFDIIGPVAVTLSNMTIQNGRRSANGGGIQNAGDLTLTNVTVTGNTAVGFSFGGGLSSFGSLTATNSTFSGNTADQGGGIYVGNGTAVLSSVTLSGNTATGSSADGGGLYVESSTSATLTDSTLSGNTADNNGGGLLNFGNVTLTNATFTANTAGGDGGGLLNFQTLQLKNTIIAGNLDNSSGTN
ncbi:MAG: CSLREA domain-containing protein, partial [Chloroflexi bacterium]|nr:CSLREA domain-containing protein [Chloroflexota bacterium]